MACNRRGSRHSGGVGTPSIPSARILLSRSVKPISANARGRNSGSKQYINVGAKLAVASSTITHGSQLTALNTGVPAGRTLTNVASTINVTESWITNSNGGSRIIQDRNFLSGASIAIWVNNVTIQYCKFNGVSGIYFLPDSYTDTITGTQILYCELDGNNQNTGAGVAARGSQLTLKGCSIHNWSLGMWVGKGGMLVEECYMYNLFQDGSGAHSTCIYVGGGNNQIYRRNKLISNFLGTNNQISSSLSLTPTAAA